MTKSQQLGGLLSFLLLIGTPLTTLAANNTQSDDKKEATSKTGFTLSGGDLSLNSQNEFHFFEKSVENIIKGTTTLNISSAPSLTIQDYRGTHEGWTLSVAMSNLTTPDSKDSNGHDRAITKPTLKIKPPVLTADSQKLNVEKNISLTDSRTPQAVLYAPKDSGEGNTQLKFTDAEITIPKQYDISKGNYTADLQWTLAKATEAPGPAQ